MSVRLAILFALLGCAESDRVPPAPDARAADAPVARPSDVQSEPEVSARAPPMHLPLRAGQVIDVPLGIVHVGSRPATEGRVPRHEADLAALELPAFRIDRLPYPNDPARASLVRVSRDDARSLCAAEGKRLCSELEWERACKGDGVLDYPGGDAFDVEGCSLDPLACASPLDVLSMGVAAFEWTSSDVSRGLGSERFAAVVRGGRPADAAPAHRCGARHALDPAMGEPTTTFRCCDGPDVALVYPEEPARRAFRQEVMEPAELSRMLASVPELARFAPHFRIFTPEEVARVLARGNTEPETVTWRLTSGPLVWAPQHGEEALVIAGTDGESSLVAVLHPLADGTVVHGTSFVLADERAPIALAWDYGQRRMIQWSSSWGRGGEGGVIELRDDHRIVIVQR